MWVLALVFLAICVESGKAGLWVVQIAGIFFLLSLVSMGAGMIWPWPSGERPDAWADPAAEPSWKYLIHARTLAEQWVLGRWGTKQAAALAGWSGLGLAFLSLLAFLTFEAEALFPESTWPRTVADWLLWLLLAVGFLLFLFSVFRIKVPNVKSAQEVIREDLHGEMVLLGEWRTFCESIPLPFSLWRYLRLLLPAGGWAYHHFSHGGQPAALTAVVGIAMAYFAWVMVDASFDLLAAVHGVEICPCRSPYLARVVWEAQFLSQRHKPFWAKVLSAIGI
ncbi:MAG: hypothetical protein AB7T01_02245 [Acidithiobacillus sp.]